MNEFEKMLAQQRAVAEEVARANEAAESASQQMLMQIQEMTEKRERVTPRSSTAQRLLALLQYCEAFPRFIVEGKASEALRADALALVDESLEDIEVSEVRQATLARVKKVWSENLKDPEHDFPLEEGDDVLAVKRDDVVFVSSVDVGAGRVYFREGNRDVDWFPLEDFSEDDQKRLSVGSRVRVYVARVRLKHRGTCTISKLMLLP